jgi:hypothetical protein
MTPSGRLSTTYVGSGNKTKRQKIVKNALVLQYLEERHDELWGAFQIILEWFRAESRQVEKLIYKCSPDPHLVTVFASYQ